MHGTSQRQDGQPGVLLPRGRCFALAMTALLLAGGCPQRVVPPKATLDAYVQALRSHDYERAYRLLSKSFRDEYDRAEFVRFLRRHPKAVAETVAELSRRPDKVRLVARYHFGPGQQVRLVREASGWRLALDPVTLYSQRTPRLALRSFVRALEHRRYRILLRFVPRKYRRVMTVQDAKRLYEGKKAEETRRLIRNLKANLDKRIEVKGDRAEMLYGDRYKVEFLREDGVWKILDAD